MAGTLKPKCMRPSSGLARELWEESHPLPKPKSPSSQDSKRPKLLQTAVATIGSSMPMPFEPFTIYQNIPQHPILNI